MDVKPLGMMNPGSSGTVKSIVADGSDESLLIAERLREMGFGEGLKVEVRHDSPFGRDPMAVRVGSMLVALRRKEAAQIMVDQTREQAA